MIYNVQVRSGRAGHIAASLRIEFGSLGILWRSDMEQKKALKSPACLQKLPFEGQMETRNVQGCFRVLNR